MLQILYEDENVIVVWKPDGVESQSSRGLGMDMVSLIKTHIHNSSPGSGEPYVGVIHRLDKPVSGILVYAKDKKSAASLSRQVCGDGMEKKYLAVFCGQVDKNVDKFVDYLLKEEKNNISRIVDKGITGAKRAELSYRVWQSRERDPYGRLTLAEVTLLTGRHHQIRVQMAGHGLPLFGDRKYNPGFAAMQKGGEKLALSAYRLSFLHPATGERLTFRRMPGGEVFEGFDLDGL
ncbi:RluA family pseudouridine synthase [Clostridiaceae bacterium]|nr:RluA family pseudouridine synthase [Clostridiaceae bacterium]RKI10570.1 RluA family pseudouridine synthase [bacterium 1XD21-70]